MPRSLWNGTVSFGLVNVPVKLFSATESKTIHFHEVHESDGARIEHRRFCTKEDQEVEYKDVAKGYEVRKNTYVMLEKDEIAAASGERTHVIDVEAFVCLADIEPTFFEKAYFLGAGDKGEDAYRLLREALEKTGRAALGRFTFHNREYLAAIRPLDGVLALHTMHFADELVHPGDIEFKKPKPGPGKREIEMAGKLVESLHEPFKPEKYKDEYRKAVLALLKRKSEGKEIEPPDEEEPEETPDLMAALEASLAAVEPDEKKDRAAGKKTKKTAKREKAAAKS
jgi:DNA end-binding protein Ku